jgi:tetratricopeptide (TPR) repeat protein
MTDTAPANTATDSTPLATLPGSAPIPPREAWGVGLLLFAIAFASAALSLGGGFLWADDAAVTDNRLLLNSQGLATLWLHPLTEKLARYPLTEYAPFSYTIYYLQHLAFGNAALPYRIVSVLLHGACGWMAWLLLRRLGAPAPWLAAAIFVAHPLQVQTVSWVAQQPMLISAALGLAALYLLTRSAGAIVVPARPDGALPESPGRLYAIGLLVFTLACLADARAGVLALLLIFLVWWRLGTDLRKLPARIVIWPGLIGLVFTAVAIQLQRVRSGATWSFGSNLAGDLAVRLQLAGLSAWHYFVKALVPFPLRVDDPQWSISTSTFGGYIAFAAVVAAIVGTWTWRRHGLRIPFLAVTSFVIVLLPALHFVNLASQRYHYVADRYAYLAVLPVAALLAWVVFAFARKALPVFGAVIVIALLALSIERSRHYASFEAFATSADAGRAGSYLVPSARAERALKTKDFEAMRTNGARMTILAMDGPVPVHGAVDGAWYSAEADRLEGNLGSAIPRLEAVVLANPKYAPARRSLGLAWLAAGDVGKAKFNLERAIETDLRDGYARVAYAEMLMDQLIRGTTDVAQREKLFETANGFFVDAIEVDPNNPDHHMAYSRALWTVNQRQRAATEVNAAAELDSDRADVAASMSELFRLRDELDAATLWADRAVERDRKLPEAHLARSRVLAARTKIDDAIAALQAGLKELPDHPTLLMELAGYFVTKGDYDTAAATLERRLAYTPRAMDVLARLAEVRGKQGNRDALADVLQRMVGIDPTNARVVFELAKLRKDQGRLDEAVELAEAFVRLRPTVAEGKVMLDDMKQSRAATRPSTQPAAN